MTTEHSWEHGPDGPYYHCAVCSISKVDDHHGYDCEGWQKKIERDYRNEVGFTRGNLIQVGALHCHKCDDIIYSRAGHDLHWCGCGDIYIDGGRGYMRAGAKDNADYSGLTLVLPVTQRELYDDWNNRTDEYGWLRKSATNLPARRSALVAPSISGL